MTVAADGETVGAVVTFAPPAVHDAQVQAAVTTGLLPAGAGGFQGAARIVQPDVAAGNHLPRHMNVIILDEHQVALQFAVFAQMNDALDVSFAVVVARMRLAGENELHGPVAVIDQFDDVLELIKNQRRALVSGEAPRKANGQRVGIQQLIESDKIRLRLALAQAAAGKLDQFPPQFVAQRPEFFVGNEIRVGHFLPELRRVDFLLQRNGLRVLPKGRRFARGQLRASAPAPESLRCQNLRTGPFIQPVR